MCQLFAINTTHTLPSNDLLAEFFSHAEKHPHGWGIADLSLKEAQIIHGADRADESDKVKELLSRPISFKNALAHIRFATVGQVELINCHPFGGKDASGRHWTLMHKGTIFKFEPLDDYFHTQLGSTDSERILLYLLDKLNAAIYEKGAPLEADERFAVFEELTRAMAPRNCLNLIVFDSDQFYVYSNYAGGLNALHTDSRVIFSTAKLSSALPQADPEAQWEPLQLNTPFVYKHGNKIAAGLTQVGVSYVDNEDDSRYLYQDFAAL